MVNSIKELCKPLQKLPLIVSMSFCAAANSSRSVGNLTGTRGQPGTIRATIYARAHLHAVAENLASAMRTLGCEGVRGAFKAIEDARPTALSHAERRIVIVTTHITNSHPCLQYMRSGMPVHPISLTT